jgi:hypothetical protein
MRKMYQSHWHNIQFSDFTELSSRNLAGPEFYQAFYEEFFRRYQSWEQLPLSRHKSKELWADLVLTRSEGGEKVLSVGCGLGHMEHYIRSRSPQLDLFVHEVAPSAWRWIESEFSEERKFLGRIPGCLPSDLQFDLIYLSGVDYALDDDSLIALLAAIRPFLVDEGGQCLIISGSFDEKPVTLRGKADALVSWVKRFAATVLDKVGLRPRREQFWGWIRTREEYQTLMQSAGYCGIEDGLIDPNQRTSYWISGSKNI